MTGGTFGGALVVGMSWEQRSECPGLRYYVTSVYRADISVRYIDTVA